MARGINKVILIGNLGRDPEMRYTANQQPIANFSVATSDSWTDRNSNERQERTEWHRVACFGRLAEICEQYLRKGSKVYIEGRLQTRSWEGQDGQTRYATEIIARDMQMLDSRGGENYSAPGPSGPPPSDPGDYGSREPARSAPRSAAPSPAPPADDDFEDDIPF